MKAKKMLFLSLVIALGIVSCNLHAQDKPLAQPPEWTITTIDGPTVNQIVGGMRGAVWARGEDGTVYRWNRKEKMFKKQGDIKLKTIAFAGRGVMMGIDTKGKVVQYKRPRDGKRQKNRLENRKKKLEKRLATLEEKLKKPTTETLPDYPDGPPTDDFFGPPNL